MALPVQPTVAVLHLTMEQYLDLCSSNSIPIWPKSPGPRLIQLSVDELERCIWHWQGHKETVPHPSHQQHCIIRG